MKIKDLFLKSLNENKENFFYLDESSVKDVVDMSLSKDDNYVRIDFITSYDKPMSIVVNYDNFLKWYKEYKEKGSDPLVVLKKYIQNFLDQSTETEPFLANMNEIIDDNGDVMPSTDLPSNATNTMVGDKIKWDLEKVYRTSVPKSLKFYSGTLGIGLITW